jgi:CheY-like chemotaxis protein
MSHELRTPLNIIMGMSEALQDGVYGSLNEKQLKALHRITEGGNHLLALITDILALSVISTGRKELDIGPVAVESVCQAGLRFINRSVQKKGVKLSFMFDSAVTTIYTDGRRLKQVLVNLLNNAVKFTPEGGEIGLDVETDPENYVVRFTVWDTGIGIAKEDMKRLFQPFVQLDSSLSRRYEGTGLGLNLVYRIVDILGGSVSVESEVERGSRFTISLPWEELRNGEMGRVGDGESRRKGEREKGRKGEREPSPYSPHLPISPSPQSATILIADDNEITIQTLSRFFTLKGYRLKIARNGWETFAYTRETCPVLILVDIQMPEMDGLETIRHIRADKSGQFIPIIALTSLAIPGDQEECLAAGANMYLIKPVGPRKLSEIIENFLSGKE